LHPITIIYGAFLALLAAGAALVVNGAVRVAPGTLPEHFDVSRWRRRRHALWNWWIGIATPFWLVSVTAWLLGDDFLSSDPIGHAAVGLGLGIVLPSFLYSLLQEPHHERLKSMVAARLLEDGAGPGFREGGAFVGILTRDREFYLGGDLAEDVGWLAIDGDRIVYSGMLYRFEIEREWLKELYRTRDWRDSFALWGGRLCCLSYTEPCGVERRIRMVACGGRTVLAYIWAGRELWRRLTAWAQAAPREGADARGKRVPSAQSR